MTGCATRQTYWCEYAWLPHGPEQAVAITVDGGTITDVVTDTPRGGTVLDGLVLPGFANVHSHAFHRALRGRTQSGGGTFWSWRQGMYELAARLDPDSYYELARGVFAEMAMAGYTSVGEFHYLHHTRDGSRYADSHAMAHSLAVAAREAGIRLTVLDTCYLRGGINGEPLGEVQARFTDGDAERWAERVSSFDSGSTQVRVGAAVHSVRAVPVEQIPVVVDWAQTSSAPLHAHISEQRSENEACQAVYGRSPTVLFAEAGAIDERFVAVHATHLSTVDMNWLGSRSAWICLCPTTEQDLGDGIGPARDLADAGARLSVGSDSHAVVDVFGELRGMEMGERLARESRGHFTPAELVDTGTAHASIGWSEVTGITQGAPADLVNITTSSVRTAGSVPAGIPLCATASDVRHVMVAGAWIVRDGQHLGVQEPAAALDSSISRLLS